MPPGGKWVQNPNTLAWSAPLAHTGAHHGPGSVRQTDSSRPHCDSASKSIVYDKGVAPGGKDILDNKVTEAPGAAAASGIARVASPSGAYKPHRRAAAAATAGCRRAIAGLLSFSLFLPLSALPTASSSWPGRTGLHATTGHFLRDSDPPPSS